MLILFLVQSERGEGDTGDPDTAASVIASSATQHVFDRGVCFTYTRRSVPTDEFGESYLLTIGLILKNQEAKQDVLSKLDSELYLIIMDQCTTWPL